MPKCNGTPSIGATASFFIRPTVIGGDILRDDYMIRQNFRDIGRIRFAPELSSQGRTLFARAAALGIFSGTFFEIIGYIAARPWLIGKKGLRECFVSLREAFWGVADLFVASADRNYVIVLRAEHNDAAW